MNPFRKPVLSGLLLALGAGSTQAVELTRRTSNVFGNFLVGAGPVLDSGSFSELLFTLDTAYGRDANDAGAVNGSLNGQPVTGSASFASGTHYAVGDAVIWGNGHATTTGETPFGYVSLGANAISALRLEFTVDVPTPFVITGSVLHTLGPGVDTRVSEAGASVFFSGCVGCAWDSAHAPGAFSGSGTLIPGNTYSLQANASTRINGDAQYAINLQLSPVPEPAAWLLLAVAIPALLWRRRDQENPT